MAVVIIRPVDSGAPTLPGLDPLRRALADAVKELRGHTPVQRASVRLLENEDDDLRFVAVWSDGPTVLTEGLTYRTELSSLAEALQAPVIREVDASRDIIEGILWDEGLRVYATLAIRTGERPAGLLTFGSREVDAFERVGEAVLTGLADGIGSVLTD